MFGRKPKEPKEGDHVFLAKPNGEYKKFIFGTITGVNENKIGINGVIVDPVGLLNKVKQGKAGTRSQEILENPTPENCIFSLIYRIEHENFTDVIDIVETRITQIPPKTYSVLDGWVRESLPELLNNVLSLPAGSEKDHAKQILRQRMDTLYDKNLKRNLYSVCRSLRILN
ncbi:MAG: hypothetical protein ACE5RN_05615 [Nitrosopumilaceae archaeon]